MKLIKYQAKVELDEDGVTVTFPDLPGCITQGDTLEEALAHAIEALDLYLEEANNPKWEIPIPKERKGKNYHWVSPSPEISVPLTLKIMRLTEKVSQSALALKMGIKVQQVQKLEYIKKSNPTAKKMIELMDELGYELSFTKKEK